MKVKNLLIVVTAFLLVVSMTAFCVFLGIQLSANAESAQKTFLNDFSSSQAADLDGYLSMVKAKLTTVTELRPVQEYCSGYIDRADEIQRLFDVIVANSGVTSALIYDTSGKIAVGSGVDMSLPADSVCALDAEDNVPVIKTAPGNYASEYSVSVKTAISTKYSVALVFDQPNEQDTAGVRSILAHSNRKIFIVDPNGAILTAATYSGSIDSAQDNNSQYVRYAGNVHSASTQPTSVVNGDEVASITATPDNWVIVAVDLVSSINRFSLSATTTTIGIAVLLFFVFFIASIVLVILVTKPLYRIEETVIKISRGNHEARIDIMSKNEYGDIARVFNNIVDDIIVSESRYRTIIEMSDNIIFEWNFINNEVIFSNNFNKKFSYRAPSDHFADSFLLKCKVHPEDSDRYKSDLEKLAKGENFKHNEYRMKNIYGDYIWVLIRTATICDKEGSPVKSVGVIVDIDRAKKSENMLTARASFDSLTGVYNRETIEGAINNEIELISARKNEFAILFVDVDDFKFFNDQYSHATGDQVLRFVATTIRNALGENGMAGRYGGDEFILCLKNSDVNDPAIIAEQILNTLKEGFDSDTGDHLTINVSIGISIIKDDTKRVEEIIGMADDAMYRIKKNGKSNYGFLVEE